MYYFLTFGAGNSYIDAVQRLARQADEFKLFTEIFCMTESDLKEDLEFWGKHGEFMMNNRKGYGYYIWKPYIISKTLSKLEKDDILLYLDAGCELNLKYKDELICLLDKISSTFSPYIKLIASLD